MGLDAQVKCDCFEKGALKTQPRPEWKVYVHPDGGRATEADTLEMELLFDRWNRVACEHEFGTFFYRPIGNVSLVGTLRRLLSERPEEFRILLENVLYNGTHGGDFLPIEQVKELQIEVERLSKFNAQDSEKEKHLRAFETTMRELVECALKLNKPLVF